MQLSDATIHNRIRSNAWEHTFPEGPPRAGPSFSVPQRSFGPATYAKEMREALERWAEHIETITRA
jgi:hypothetical protein